MATKNAPSKSGNPSMPMKPPPGMTPGSKQKPKK